MPLYLKDIPEALKNLDIRPLAEAIKGLFRLLVIAALPFAYEWAQTGSLDFPALKYILIVTGIKFIDELVHETGKILQEKDITPKLAEFLVKGLTRF